MNNKNTLWDRGRVILYIKRQSRPQQQITEGIVKFCLVNDISILLNQIRFVLQITKTNKDKKSCVICVFGMTNSTTPYDSRPIELSFYCNTYASTVSLHSYWSRLKYSKSHCIHRIYKHQLSTPNQAMMKSGNIVSGIVQFSFKAKKNQTSDSFY